MHTITMASSCQRPNGSSYSIPVSKDYTKRLDRDNLIPLSDKRHGIVHKQMKEGREEEIIQLLLEYKEKWKKKENSEVGGVVKLF